MGSRCMISYLLVRTSFICEEITFLKLLGSDKNETNNLDDESQSIFELNKILLLL